MPTRRPLPLAPILPFWSTFWPEWDAWCNARGRRILRNPKGTARRRLKEQFQQYLAREHANCMTHEQLLERAREFLEKVK